MMYEVAWLGRFYILRKGLDSQYRGYHISYLQLFYYIGLHFKHRPSYTALGIVKGVDLNMVLLKHF